MKKLVLLLVGIFMISSVYALGVMPGRTTIDFKPGLQKEVSFEIINSNGKDIELSLSMDGELADYISVGLTRVSILSSESSKVLNYNINLPDSLEPGVRTGRIVITEIPKDVGSADSYVAATLAVATQIYVNVPYPGKYATSGMVVYNAGEGEEVTFIFPVTNRGEFDLTSVKANVDVYNSLNEKVGSFNTNSIVIPSGDKRELVYKWVADVPIGEYRASATVIYDEGVINLEETFRVGNKELELEEINVNNFKLGEIVKLEMLVENKWSEPITGVYVKTQIKNDLGNIVSNFESATYSIEPLVKQVFVSYWDTAGVKVGNYDAEVSINYGDKSSKKNLEFQVEENELTIIGLGYVISTESDRDSSLVMILVVAIVVLVFVNLIWFLWIRKKIKIKN